MAVRLLDDADGTHLSQRLYFNGRTASRTDRATQGMFSKRHAPHLSKKPPLRFVTNGPPTREGYSCMARPTKQVVRCSCIGAGRHRWHSNTDRACGFSVALCRVRVIRLQQPRHSDVKPVPRCTLHRGSREIHS